jgi:hypothetical protein
MQSTKVVYVHQLAEQLGSAHAHSLLQSVRAAGKSKSHFWTLRKKLSEKLCALLGNKHAAAGTNP